MKREMSVPRVSGRRKQPTMPDFGLRDNEVDEDVRELFKVGPGSGSFQKRMAQSRKRAAQWNSVCCCCGCPLSSSLSVFLCAFLHPSPPFCFIVVL